MIKKVITIFFLLCVITPVFAGVYENALKEKKSAFLYLYTKDCGYCKKFNPVYEKLLKAHSKDCPFFKIDAMTPYGMKLMKDFRTNYVPFVVVSKNDVFIIINMRCLENYSCTEKVFNNVINK